MGRLQIPVLAQLLFFQAILPWPSNVPPPKMVNRSMFLKAIHPSCELNALSDDGARRVPSALMVTEALHGPRNSTGPNVQILLGITIVLGLMDPHASLQVLIKA